MDANDAIMNKVTCSVYLHTYSFSSLFGMCLDTAAIIEWADWVVVFQQENEALYVDKPI